MLVRPHEVIAKAHNMQYALGAFNTSNLEFSQAIIWAAEKKQAPVIVQTSESALKYAGVKTIAGIVKSLAEAAKIPVVLHLDHGHSFEVAQECIEAGYTSVMIDASTQSFADNVATTSKVAEYAHSRGVWVEAELGAILGKEGAYKEYESDPNKFFTKPEQAAEFVQKTGVDSLAVAVGTIHGAFTGQEYIRFELLREIEQAVPSVPLVLHGGSGLSEKHLQEAATTNVCKINVDTELRIRFEEAVRAYRPEVEGKCDPRALLGAGREAVQLEVEHQIELFGSNNQA